jgi:hypothetical protein
VSDVNPAFYPYLADLYPADLDPKFTGAGFNDTYLTAVPGTRDDLFYNTATADPLVIQHDEDLKQTATTGELNTVGSTRR